MALGAVLMLVVSGSVSAGSAADNESSIRNGTFIVGDDSIDLMIDALVVHDVSGPIDGVYADANAALLPGLVKDAQRMLSGRAELFDMFASNGLVFDKDPGLRQAKNDKLIDDAFLPGIQYSSFADVSAPDASMVFQQVITKANTGSGDFTQFDIRLPDSLVNDGSRFLLVIQTLGYDMSAMKSISIGVATSLAGGSGVMPTANVTVTVALIDKYRRKALWAMQRQLKDYEKIQAQSMKIIRELAKLMPRKTAYTLATGSDSVSGYTNLADAKAVLRAGGMTREQYDPIAKALAARYESELDALEKKKKSGAISEPAFEILAARAKLDYAGD